MPGGRLTHCDSCHLDGMVKKQERTCICGQTTSIKFGFLEAIGDKKKTTPTHCCKCKTAGMVYVERERAKRKKLEAEKTSERSKPLTSYFS